MCVSRLLALVRLRSKVARARGSETHTSSHNREKAELSEENELTASFRAFFSCLGNDDKRQIRPHKYYLIIFILSVRKKNSLGNLCYSHHNLPEGLKPNEIYPTQYQLEKLQFNRFQY